MTTFVEALNLAKSEKAKGFILDYYVSPLSGCIIAVSDQGEYVWFDAEDWEES